MICGLSISTHVSDNRISTTNDLTSVAPLSAVRTKAVWELFEPSTAEKPAQRTGHAVITFGDRIIMYAHRFLCYAAGMLTVRQFWWN
jgi:hypothetical protein